VGLPLWRSAYHRIQVASVVEERPGVWSVYLSGRHLHRLRARAGQFFNWRFLSGPGWTRAHPYSLSAGPRADLLRITIGSVGTDSSAIGRLRAGTRVLVEGPYGRMTTDLSLGHDVTLIGAGLGTTPLRALAEELASRPGPGSTTFVVRSSDERDLLFRDELV